LFRGTDPSKARKRIGTRKPHPSDVTLWVTRGAPWVNDIRHEATRIVINLLITDNTIIGFEDSLSLLLNRQRLVIGKRIFEALVRMSNLTRIVRHDG